MKKESRIEKICADSDGDALPQSHAKRFPPPAIPQTTLKPTSQNPQERRCSLPGGGAALLSSSPTSGPLRPPGKLRLPLFEVCPGKRGGGDRLDTVVRFLSLQIRMNPPTIYPY